MRGVVFVVLTVRMHLHHITTAHMRLPSAIKVTHDSVCELSSLCLCCLIIYGDQRCFDPSNMPDQAGNDTPPENGAATGDGNRMTLPLPEKFTASTGPKQTELWSKWLKRFQWYTLVQ